MPDDILAVEPGDRLDERQRHLQFRHLPVGTSEYFQQADDLTAHVQARSCALTEGHLAATTHRDLSL
ncbi:hypothetical protein [Actinacidiphila glaucinigra]|uniref:hypothetical protein n=1 Tax=Actinacidiphila glaucinigra TaxID=235986 RepID=UPI002E2F022B|nr:hypothetical protein [Actinacidiphila glaucinigra]